MAFGRLERSAASQPMGEINMTPLIDVMLVLLVIFMITAPLMTSSLKLDLPKAEAGSPVNGAVTVSLAIDAEGRLYLDDKPVEAPQIVERARSAAGRNPDTEVQLRADSRVPYGRVAEVIGLVQEAGLSRIGLIAQPPAK
jgi:biopolymer transport protein ExbD